MLIEAKEMENKEQSKVIETKARENEALINQNVTLNRVIDDQLKQLEAYDRLKQEKERLIEDLKALVLQLQMQAVKD